MYINLLIDHCRKNKIQEKLINLIIYKKKLLKKGKTIEKNKKII